MNQETQGYQESGNSFKLNKQIYLLPQKTIETAQLTLTEQLKHSLPQTESVPQQSDIHPAENTLSSEQIYKEHRQFLDNYKRQRERQRAVKTSNHNHGWQPELNLQERRRSASVAQGSVPSKQNEAFVMQKLSEIQQRLAQQIVSQKTRNDKPLFKLFTEVVENKNDIQRVSKERRFLRSQNSKHYEYQQPAMPNRSRLPAGLRVKTESIVDEVELCRNARDFIQRVQKDQERLLGKHLMRRKIEEGRRAKQEDQEDRRLVEESQHKREERKLKAEANLLLMKERIKIAKLINRQNTEPTEGSSTKEFRHSLRGDKPKPIETKRPRMEVERVKQLNRVVTDRLTGFKDSEFNIKDRIAIRKHKVYRPTEYREQQLKENRHEKSIEVNEPERTFIDQSEKTVIQQSRVAKEVMNLEEMRDATMLTQEDQNEFITYPQSRDLVKESDSRVKDQRIKKVGRCKE